MKDSETFWSVNLAKATVRNSLMHSAEIKFTDQKILEKLIPVSFTEWMLSTAKQ